MAAAPRAYEFDGFRIDLALYRVVDPSGAAMSLSNRAYDVLVYLIENRGRVVEKDELMKAVWQKVIVEENNLNQAISLLRRALIDQRASPRYIATIPGRGYRFVGHVTVEFEEEPQDAPPPPAAKLVAEATVMVQPAALADRSANDTSNGFTLARPTTRRRALVAFGALAAGVTASWLLWRQGQAPSVDAPRSIAVLPFQPLIDNDANDALQLGIADTLIARLSGLPGVVVAPFSSVRSLRGHDEDPISAGRALNVDSVLESHIQIQADRVRLTSRLLDVGSGAALWSGRFDEALSDFFTVQDALAKSVVEALEVQLSADTLRRLKRHDTDDVEAWQLYLQGRFHWGTRTEDGFRRAIDAYNAALALDPKFASAAAGLADAWAVLGVFNMIPPRPAFQRAQAAAERAIELDSQLAEAQAALGHVVVQSQHEWARGEQLYRRALTMKPTYGQAVFWLANNLCYQGRMADALVQGQLSQSMEPMSVAFAANVGMLLYFARDFAAAHSRLKGLVEAVPQSTLARHHFVRVLTAQGHIANALELLKGHEDDRTPGGFAVFGRALALDGQIDAARREVARIEALGVEGFGVGYDLALIRTALGDRDAALAALERGVDDGSQTIGFMNAEPALDPIRNEPRFIAVSQKLKLS